jgi:hypothetical protein
LVKVISIPDKVREKLVLKYFKYCKEIFLIKFLHWRMLKLKYLEAEVAMDWNLEIPKMYDYMRNLEK